MTARRDAYWDELGVSWCAVDPESAILGPRFQARLRRQSLLITAALVMGLPLSAVGVVLGLFTIWIGWTTGAWNFVARGVALESMSAMLAMGVSQLLPIRTGDVARPVSDMLDLAIARAQRTLIAIRLGLIACAVAAVCGLGGTAIRTYLTGPPRMSPLIDLSVLVIFALGLVAYRRRLKINLEKLRALERALRVDETVT